MARDCAIMRSIETDIYNSIPLFEDQRHDILPDDLREIGKILVRHDYHSKFSVCSIHRHFELLPKTLMVYLRRPDGLLGCNIESVETLPAVFPRTISLKESFSTFEYALDPPEIYPRSDFLHELARFLSDRNLQDVLALSLHAPSEILQELSLEEKPGFVYIPKQDYHVEKDTDAVVTGWRFEVQHDEIVTLPCQTCQKQGGGRHHDPDKKYRHRSELGTICNDTGDEQVKNSRG